MIPEVHLQNFIKVKILVKFLFFLAKKRKIRGHHFHHSKVEKFLVVQGRAIFNMFDISTKKNLVLN